jgi:ABC-type nitrate/sulfonate/bicarbonate transport system substrate-binding protein
MRLYVRVIALVGVMGLIGVACSDDGDGSGTTGTDGADVVRHASSSSGEAYVGQYHAPELFGDLFGISTEDQLTEFESHATAAQVLLAGQADVGSGGLTELVQLIQEGQDLKAFCPIQKDSTEHLVGRTEAITSLDQITDPEIRVAVDSPGGLINFIMNLVFAEKGMGITVDDLENVTILEDGSLRLSALAADEVDVGSVDLFEVADLREQLGEDAITVLSVTAADADFLANIYFAPSAWLEENVDLAGRYCATTLYSNRLLASDLEEYKSVVNQFIEGGVPDDVIQGVWEFAREYEIWPYNDDTLSPEAVQQVIEVSVASGLLDETALDLTFEDVVDTRPLEVAMDVLGGPIDPQDVLDGNVPAPQ